MEPTESGLSSYYHHHHNHHPQPHPPPPPPPQQSPTAAATSNTTATVVTASPTNGTLPPHMAYTHSASSTVTPASEAAKRKRGRPRKYSTPEEAAAARKALLASAPKKKKKDRSIEGGVSSSFSSSYSKKTNLASLSVDNGGQGFAAHILTVDWGQDVYQTIMSFMQKNKCEICILSASGSISNPSLRQPATFGGNITYEGNFHILSLSGSYIHTELGGRSGGLSVCLSNTDGHIIGGGIGGPLKAAGPVQVIVGAFQIDTRKDMHAGMKGDATFLNFQSPVGGTSVS